MADRNTSTAIIETRGDTITRQLAVTVAGALYALKEGEKVYFTVTDDNGVAVIQKSYTASDLIDGKIVITIQPEETASLPYKAYTYDVEVHFLPPIGIKTIVKHSLFKITKEDTTLKNIVEMEA